jgi:hypothetical protein
MRIAELVNHQIFERTWHFLEWESMLVSVSSPLTPQGVVFELHGPLLSPRRFKRGNTKQSPAQTKE